MEGGYHLVKICKSRQLRGNLDSTDYACGFSFQALTSLELSSARNIFLLKSSWMKSKKNPAAHEEYIIKFCYYHARAQSLKHLPHIYWFHINNWGEYLQIYCEEGYNYDKGVVLDTVNLLRFLLPKGCPHLFFIWSNYKVCCLNLEYDQVDFVL